MRNSSCIRGRLKGDSFFAGKGVRAWRSVAFGLSAMGKD